MGSDYMNSYMRDRRKARRAKFISLKGGKCADCGANENLQFDHINPRHKEFDYNTIKDAPEKIIMKELKKCILLCAKCHLEKTKKNKEHINRDKSPARHGTTWMYKKEKCRCPKCRMAMRMYNLQKKK